MFSNRVPGGRRWVLIVVVCVLAVGAFILLKPNRQTPQQTTSPTVPYIAFGDSVAAGQGLSNYSDASACDRTREAYPQLVADQRNYKLTSVACSGAKTTTGLLDNQIVNRLAVKPQINAIKTASKPRLITITIGANDANWTTYLQKCYTVTCGSDDDTRAVSSQASAAGANVAAALTDIVQRYPTDTPKVVVTGYYNLFGDDSVANCNELRGIDGSERAWIATLQTSINDSLHSATEKYQFATYVPLDFNGHELCSTNPWIQGLTAKAPFHPTADGQKAIASGVVAAAKKAGL